MIESSVKVFVYHLGLFYWREKGKSLYKQDKSHYHISQYLDSSSSFQENQQYLPYKIICNFISKVSLSIDNIHNKHSYLSQRKVSRDLYLTYVVIDEKYANNFLKLGINATL